MKGAVDVMGEGVASVTVVLQPLDSSTSIPHTDTTRIIAIIAFTLTATTAITDTTNMCQSTWGTKRTLTAGTSAVAGTGPVDGVVHMPSAAATMKGAVDVMVEGVASVTVVLKPLDTSTGIVRTGTVGGAACLVGAVRARPPSAAASTRLATLCSGMQMATLCSSMTAPFTTPAQRPMTSTQPSRTTLTLSEVPSTIAPAKAKSSCLLEACCDF